MRASIVFATILSFWLLSCSGEPFKLWYTVSVDSIAENNSEYDSAASLPYATFIWFSMFDTAGHDRSSISWTWSSGSLEKKRETFPVLPLHTSPTAFPQHPRISATQEGKVAITYAGSMKLAPIQRFAAHTLTQTASFYLDGNVWEQDSNSMVDVCGMDDPFSMASSCAIMGQVTVHLCNHQTGWLIGIFGFDDAQGRLVLQEDPVTLNSAVPSVDLDLINSFQDEFYIMVWADNTFGPEFKGAIRNTNNICMNVPSPSPPMPDDLPHVVDFEVDQCEDGRWATIWVRSGRPAAGQFVNTQNEIGAAFETTEDSAASQVWCHCYEAGAVFFTRVGSGEIKFRTHLTVGTALFPTPISVVHDAGQPVATAVSKVSGTTAVCFVVGGLLGCRLYEAEGNIIRGFVVDASLGLVGTGTLTTLSVTMQGSNSMTVGYNAAVPSGNELYYKTFALDGTYESQRTFAMGGETGGRLESTDSFLVYSSLFTPDYGSRGLQAKKIFSHDLDTIDCRGEPGGTATIDLCGVCGGNSQSCCLDYLGLDNKMWDWLLLQGAISEVTEKLEFLHSAVKCSQDELPRIIESCTNPEEVFKANNETFTLVRSLKDPIHKYTIPALNWHDTCLKSFNGLLHSLTCGLDPSECCPQH